MIFFFWQPWLHKDGSLRGQSQSLTKKNQNDLSVQEHFGHTWGWWGCTQRPRGGTISGGRWPPPLKQTLMSRLSPPPNTPIHHLHKKAGPTIDLSIRSCCLTEQRQNWVTSLMIKSCPFNTSVFKWCLRRSHPIIGRCCSDVWPPPPPPNPLVRTASVHHSSGTIHQ